MLPKFSHVRPKALREALALLDGREARIHGGGTDLLGCLRDRVFTTDTVVSLSAIDDLSGIAATPDGGLRLGAMTTIADIAGHAGIADRYTALHDAASVVASPQLRNQGTIGGNLCQKPRCWYYRGDFRCLRKGGELCYAYGGENQFHCIFGGDMCYIVHPSDTAPALAALGAVCRISGPTAGRSVAVETLHVPPSVDPQRETVLDDDEVITEVVLPPPTPGARSSYRKVRARASWDFALAGIALALVFDADAVRSARVFLSGAAPIPWRSRAVEDAITGHALDASTIAAASSAVVDGAEPLAENGYKLELFKGLMAEQLSAISKA
jgi:xanthine dehydrogenase YagS FAD-binding subunit